MPLAEPATSIVYLYSYDVFDETIEDPSVPILRKVQVPQSIIQHVNGYNRAEARRWLS